MTDEPVASLPPKPAEPAEPPPVTSTTRPLPRIGSGDHQAALLLAHLHLRLGSLALARAELETLAGRDALDDTGLVDLAEARWRTGDVAGAGEAAAVILGDGDDGPLVALVVAAEAALLRGRPSEARRYAAKAVTAAGGNLDAVFAGMPRGPVWPVDKLTLAQPAPTLFDGPDHRRGRGRLGSTTIRAHEDHLAEEALPIDAGTVAAAGLVAADRDGGSPPPTRPEPASMALWAGLEDEAPAPADPTEAVDEATERAASGSSAVTADESEAFWSPTAAPDPADGSDTSDASDASAPGDAPPPPFVATDLPASADALVRGRSSLDAGDLDGAAAQLGLALRLAPDLAPDILDVIGDRRDARLAFVRGDAYRLVGREAEARLAYADAVRPIRSTDPTTDPPSEGDPA